MRKVPVWALLLVAGVALLIGLLVVRAPEPASRPVPKAASAPLPGEAGLSAQAEVGRSWLRPPNTAAEYAGDAACRDCHRKEYDQLQHSPHSQTLRRLSAKEYPPEFQHAQPVRDEPHGVLLGTESNANTCKLTALQPGKTDNAVPEWSLGSGKQAHTYLWPAGDGFQESRITYYSRWKRWGFTPGRGPDHPTDPPLGKVYTPLEAASCFGCHSTVVVGNERALDLSRMLPGVGCEACHGPSRRHAVQAQLQKSKRDTTGNSAAPASTKPEVPRGAQALAICSRCHRSPEATPGSPLPEELLAPLTGVALGRSRCFRESDGRLTCTNCHLPHSPVATGLTAYDRACLSCHRGTRGIACKAGKTKACAGCHMPASPTSEQLPLRLHSHRIRIVRGKGDL